MTQLQGPHFSTAEFEAVPDLESRLFKHSPYLREVSEFKQTILSPDEYLEWLMNQVTAQIYGVTHAVSPRRERGSGRQKAGSHSEGRHH